MKEITIDVHATGIGKRTDVTAHDHVFTIDEPIEMGGANLGASPLEYLLGALAGCEQVIAQQIAEKIGFRLDGIEFEIQGALDPRGLAGDPGVKPYFQKVTTIARVKTPETVERVTQLQEAVEKQCPVFTLIKAAGIETETSWEKAPVIKIMSQGTSCEVDGAC